MYYGTKNPCFLYRNTVTDFLPINLLSQLLLVHGDVISLGCFVPEEFGTHEARLSQRLAQT